jgi:hypothetical protein
MTIGEIPLGDLCCGTSAWCALKVGPVVDFIAPLEEVEEMRCSNQKAIDIIERWPTFDDFYYVWNGRLERHAGTWDITIVFRGYLVEIIALRPSVQLFLSLTS